MDSKRCIQRTRNCEANKYDTQVQSITSVGIVFYYSIFFPLELQQYIAESTHTRTTTTRLLTPENYSPSEFLTQRYFFCS
jgi:hypothetical protein